MNFSKFFQKFIADHAVPVSILAGAFLISLSLFSSARILTRTWNGTGSTQSQTAKTITANPSAAPSNPAGTVAGAVTVNPRASAATLGASSAKVTLVEFSDFQCPFCEQFFTDTLPQIKAKYIATGRAKIIYRHFPLPFHQYAQKAAEAAECARDQGKFWEFHDILFTQAKLADTNLAVDKLKEYAKQLGLNTGKFNSCVDSGQMTSLVSQDANDAAAVGITGTPTMVINGQKIVGAQLFTEFEKIIDAELKK